MPSNHYSTTWSKQKKKKKLGQKKSQPTFPYMVTAVFSFLPKLSDVNLNNTPKQCILYSLFELNKQLFMSQNESHDPLKLFLPSQPILQYYKSLNVR